MFEISFKAYEELFSFGETSKQIYKNVLKTKEVPMNVSFFTED
jgi:hypothetical protein